MPMGTPGHARLGMFGRMPTERWAFVLRRAVGDVADALGVSRISVKKYLDALPGEPVRRP
jgi:hypothetical protein